NPKKLPSMASGCCVLVDSGAYIDDTNDSTNDSTARDFTTTGNQMMVSLWPAQPPIPSRLSVHCKRMRLGHVFFQEPKILCAVDCFFVLRIAMGRSPPPINITKKMSDYFIYQSASSTGSNSGTLRHGFLLLTWPTSKYEQWLRLRLKGAPPCRSSIFLVGSHLQLPA
uniref:Uncharacterized protein n=1 Tax=Aegilops tauschii subsp. strangulata TaxID=200361 RepID=A0A453JJS4_AEGTS